MQETAIWVLLCCVGRGGVAGGVKVKGVSIEPPAERARQDD